MAFLFYQTDGSFNWNAISILGSIVSSLLVVLTLIEMRTQRRHSYKPMLLLPNSRYYVQTNSVAIPSILKESMEIVEDWAIHGSYTEIGNVGLATAVNIEVKWELDSERMVKLISDLDPGYNRIETFQLDSRWEFLYRSKVVDIRNIFQCPRTEISYKIAFIKSDSSWKIIMPEALVTFLCLYTSLRLELSEGKKERNTYRFDIQIPGNLVISYWDIGKKLHRSSFNISVYVRADSPEITKTNVLAMDLEYKVPQYA
jgi:hypothetical protein